MRITLAGTAGVGSARACPIGQFRQFGGAERSDLLGSSEKSPAYGHANPSNGASCRGRERLSLSFQG